MVESREEGFRVGRQRERTEEQEKGRKEEREETMGGRYKGGRQKHRWQEKKRRTNEIKRGR
jgi:hypothetical protein